MKISEGRPLLRDVTPRYMNVPRRRFFAPPSAFAADGATVVLSQDEAHHLRKVLRLKAGDTVFVFDGRGKEYACCVPEGRESGRGGDVAVVLEVETQVEPARPESPLDLSLAVALLKSEKFDLVVQKATELGVNRIMPVMTKRADVRVHNASEATKRTLRLQRLALEAAKQSGRAHVPLVDAPLDFTELTATPAASDWAERRLMFAERGGRGLAETFSEWSALPRRVTALVGPEGGWDDDEMAQAQDAGWDVITLGGRILRAETAAIVVAALLQHLSGDLV